MNKKRFLITCLIILFSFQLVYASDLYEYETLVLEQDISNNIDIIPKNSNYFIDYLDVYLYLFPQLDYRQDILQENINPAYSSKDTNQITINFINPKESQLSFQTNYLVRTSADPVKVKEKVSFPLKDIPTEVSQYLEETTNIDINSDIRRKANSIASQQDDLFLLEYELARWVNDEIYYNLSTLTSQANEPSSWVMEKRYGVCDEITNLFISFNRALGIPARFVSGIAYTDSSLFSEPWGNHGWAEVYFPGYGWIPYDVTYNEFANIDATHISLKKSIDGNQHSIEYSTKGLEYEFEPDKLSFNTNVNSKGYKIKDLTQSKLLIKESNVGFGSYNLIELQLKNTYDYYVVKNVQLAKTTGISILNDLKQSVVLKPQETKSLYWLVKVDNNLNSQAIYTFPISAFIGISNKEVKTEFKSQQSSQIYSQNYMKQFIVKETTAKLIDVDCYIKEDLMINTQGKIICSSIEDVEVCLKNECKNINKEEKEFDIIGEKVGINTEIIKVKRGFTTQDVFVNYKVYDKTNLSIEILDYPFNISFSEQKKLSFIINKNSFAKARNVSIQISNKLFNEEWTFSELLENKQFDIVFSGSNLLFGKNDFEIKVEYTDSLNQKQNIAQNIEIELINLTNEQKVVVIINEVSANLNNVNNKVAQKLNLNKNSREVQQIIPILITVLILISSLIIIKLLIKGIMLLVKKKP